MEIIFLPTEKLYNFFFKCDIDSLVPTMQNHFHPPFCKIWRPELMASLPKKTVSEFFQFLMLESCTKEIAHSKKNAEKSIKSSHTKGEWQKTEFAWWAKNLQMSSKIASQSFWKLWWEPFGMPSSPFAKLTLLLFSLYVILGNISRMID